MNVFQIRTALLSALILCVAVVAPAQESPAFQPGSVTVVEATPVTPEILERLQAEGFTIDAREGERVRLYVSDGQLTALKSMGLTIQVLGHQPDPYPFQPGAKGLGVYHSYTTLTSELQSYAQTFPSLCRLESLGTSVQGRTLWAMRITDNPDVREEEPEVKYISTIHGDEPIGTELCLYFIDRLLNGYATDTRVRHLVDETDIYVVPLMNPDGLEIGWRYNASSKDLNRTFPNYPNQFSGTVYTATQDWTPYPTEVGLVGQWIAAHHFVLSANFHGGAALVNYPYDNNGLGSVNSPTPDDALMKALSLAYSRTNPLLWNSTTYPQGITNGAAWYAITGGMQDWNYRYTGCIDVTIELNSVKRPAASTLPGFWSTNEESMLTYLESSHWGLRGVVRDARTGAPLRAKVTIAGNTQPVFTDPATGGYYRLLLSGNYTISVEAAGHETQTLPTVTVTQGEAIRTDVALRPPSMPHSADTNGDFIIQREELMTAVALYQAGEYHWNGSGHAPGAGPHNGPPHTSDYAPQDWRIDAHEILRLIQLFNSGGYLVSVSATEDGYAPKAP